MTSDGIRMGRKGMWWLGLNFTTKQWGTVKECFQLYLKLTDALRIMHALTQRKESV